MKIKDLQLGLIEYTDGSKDHFEDFLKNQCSGTSEILDSRYKDILEAAIKAKEDEDYEVENIIAPIVAEIVKYAFYNNKTIYQELIEDILHHHGVLDTQRTETYEINENTPDLAHQFENIIHYLKNGWKIKEFKVKNPGDFAVTIGKDGEVS